MKDRLVTAHLSKKPKKCSSKLFLTLNIIIVAFAFTSIVTAKAPHPASSGKTVHSLLGEIAIDHPLIQELLDSQTMQRLHNIQQSGTAYHFGYTYPYSRYEHCVGVYAILKHFKAPLNEQVAGLLHDASHTVFSHVGDMLFAHTSHEKAYQDEIHEWYLEHSDVKPILEKYGLSVAQVNPDLPQYNALEQNLPYMCADRIEYNLHMAVIDDLITQEEVMEIINDLRFENNVWFFVNAESAKKLADISLHFTRYHSASNWNHVLYHWSVDMLKRALELNLINEDDIHFGNDREVFAVLQNTDDAKIQQLIRRCQEVETYIEVTTGDIFDFDNRSKFRGIDPLVHHEGELVHLSAISPEFQKEYHQLKQEVLAGTKLRIVNI